MDLLALHTLTHSDSDQRTMLSAPASYNDLLSALMLSRGIRPGERRSGRPQRGITRGPSVRAFDGQREIPVTPELRQAAELYRSAGLGRHMAKRTGSTPDGIAWLLAHRVEAED